MIFNGKNKEQFDEWYYNKYVNRFDIINSTITNNDLQTLPFSMQLGVYLEYANSLGYRVGVWLEDYKEPNKWSLYLENDDKIVFYSSNSMINAYKEALKEFNNTINNKKDE